jgi:hypothetical protein
MGTSPRRRSAPISTTTGARTLSPPRICGRPSGAGQFSLRLSNGDGTYGPRVVYDLPGFATGSYYSLYAIAIGDFNNDGFADVAITGAGGSNNTSDVFLYLNNGSGGLTLSATIPIAGAGPLAAGDFNHDRLMDLAYVANGKLIILFGNGKGGFTPGPQMAVNSQGEPLMVGDYDGDGNADIAFGDYVNYTTATVLYGDSTGHFVPTYVTSTEKVVFSSGDVNSDGKTDLMGRANTLAQHIDVFYGNTARSFASRTKIALAHCATLSPTVADMDGNGFNDLITVETDCSNTLGYSAPYYVGLRTRNADSSYNVEQTLYTLSNPQYGGIQYGPMVLRLDRNAKPDLAFGICSDPECLGTTMNLALNTTAGSFPACAPPNAFEGINLCSPGTTPPGTTVAFHIGAAGQVAMRKVEVWVDGSKKVEQLDGFSHYSFLDKNISLTPGSHKVTIFASGVDDWLEQKTFTLNVQ